MKDLHNNVKCTEALRAATRTADANGADINLFGYESCEFAVAVGLSGDTLSGSVKIELEVQHADDNNGSAGTYAACEDADIIGAVAGTNTGTFAVIDGAADDEQVYKAGYIGGKKWVRVVANLTGTHTNGTPLAGIAILGDARHNPVA